MTQVLALAIAADHGAALERRDEITLLAADDDRTDPDIGDGGGIVGDRHFGKRRAVTVVCTGELATAAAEHGIDQIDGVTTRRNIVVDLEALPRKHGTRFAIGEVEFEVWRDCAPCDLMDEYFGDGARQALRQRCGISASVTTGGVIRVGDEIVLG